MIFHFLLGGDEGIIYAVNQAGEMLWFQDQARNGNVGWANGGAPRIVGDGWDGYTQLVSLGGGVIVGVTEAGDLVWHRDLQRNGNTGWAFLGNGQKVATGWGKFRQIFAGGDDIIYGLTAGGDLLWHKLTVNAGVFRWAEGGVGRVIGSGFGDYRKMVCQGDGVIYGITPGGELYWYRDLARDGTSSWANDGAGRLVGAGWEGFAEVLTGGNGIFYAVRDNGDLVWYRDQAGNGTSSWANNGQGRVIGDGWSSLPVAAYSSRLSVRPGETLDFQMSARVPTRVTHLRLTPDAATPPGEPAAPAITVPPLPQPVPPQGWKTGYGWRTSFSLTVPADWRSGLYAAHCRDERGAEFHAVYVVKPATSATGDFALIANSNTWNAYNSEGRSQYGDPYNTPLLSFLRPNRAISPVAGHLHEAVATPPTDRINHLVVAETWMLGWLQRSGYKVDVYADVDLHRGITDLASYKGLILSTHPEYWSDDMFGALEDYLRAGGHLLYLAGNGLWERVEFDADFTRLVFRRGHGRYPRDLFRDQTPPRPERALVGVAFEWDSFGAPSTYYTGNQALSYAPFEVERAGHRFFQGTGLKDGDLIGAVGFNGAASGWEMDSSTARPSGSPPPNLQVLARGTNTGLPNGYSGHITYHDTAAGGWVFAAGSLSFGGSLVVDPHLQRIVRNALDECLAPR